MEPMELALVAVVLLPEPEVTALGPEVVAAVARLRQVLALVAPGVAAQVAAGNGAALAGIQQAGDGSVRGAVQAVAEAVRLRLGRGGQEKIAEKIGFSLPSFPDSGWERPSEAPPPEPRDRASGGALPGRARERGDRPVKGTGSSREIFVS
ncbi:hypothetical protein [Leptolyngbya sp. PCC 6406]|uniref:hypothetical protein n=1 Tax=Leptolyngbya sp. PCC 6406 TaxID=1173264 RepID=UPI0002ACFD01|nr:hypothetical protein [Leptolyngbya sp. PCC 6406]